MNTKAQLKISDGLIAILLISMFIGVLVLITSNGISNYNVQNFNSSKYTYFDNINDTNAQLQQIQSRSTNMSSSNTAIDWLGGLFSQAYQAIVLTKDSFGSFTLMIESAVQDLGLGEASYIIKSVLLAILIVIIFIVIILGYILKVRV